MKVLAATTTFKADLREAISKNMLSLYNEVSHQAKVTLLVPGSFESKSKDATFVIESFSDHNPYGSGRALFGNIKKLRNHLERMDLSKFDIMHIHVGFSFELFLLYSTIRKLSIPVVATIWQPYIGISDVLSLFKFNSFRLMKGVLSHIIFNSFALRPLYRIGLKPYCCIIVASRYQRKQLEQISLPGQLKQISSGVAIPSEDMIRKNTLESIPRLLYIGHYTPAKGVDCILRALSELKDRRSFNMTFAFSDRGNLKRFWMLVNKYALQKHVTVKGGVDVHYEMLRHDLFIIPYCVPIGVSYYPNVVLECFATGLPLVSTRIPVMCELLDSTNKNLLVSVNNSHALAERVFELLDDMESLSKIGESLRQLYRKHYDIPRIAKLHIEEYKRLKKGETE